MFLKLEHMKPSHLTQLTSYCLLSSSMGQNILWEVSSYLGKALLRFTCNLTCHYRVQNVPQLVCLLCSILAVCTLLPCLLKFNFHFLHLCVGF
jgi:hypothetical protein